ncbi:polysaccharide pyruvyl transferase family protein [Luteimonas abyssi]|uniref:polysaccharide pyruvyl transferase family protein n=1 Tax=Luteimonas abyssi TaxID=1247514 RepID=UPI000737C248|nr:polysaccharide pyruvyl transferase family protein [Luteimonas abyssi]
MTRECYAIIGGTLWGNRGAEAMVTTTMARVRDHRPDARFLVLSYYPDRDRILLDSPHAAIASATPMHQLLVQAPWALLCWAARKIGLRWPDRLLPPSVRDLRACTAQLDVSGISFHDNRPGALIYNVFCVWPAILHGVPVVHLSQARGPFQTSLNRQLSKRFLGACRYVFARGRATAAHIETLGLPADRWRIAADIAFGFRAGDSVTDEGPDRIRGALERLRATRAAGREIVGLSPSAVVLGKTRTAGIDYIGLLARALLHLRASGYHVVVLPNATRAGVDALRNNDLPVIAKLRREVERLAPDAIEANTTWIEQDINTDAIRALIEPCKLLITSRFHAMVAGLSLGVPVFVVGWSHKYGEVLEMFGCQDDAVDFAQLDTTLLPAIDRTLALDADRRARIAAARNEVEASSASQFDALATLLRLPTSPRGAEAQQPQ